MSNSQNICDHRLDKDSSGNIKPGIEWVNGKPVSAMNCPDCGLALGPEAIRQLVMYDV